jgi:hypothetical protein
VVDSGPTAAAARPWRVTGRTQRDQPFFLVTAGAPVMHHIGGLATDPAALSIPRQHIRFRAGEVTVVVIGGIIATPAQSARAHILAATCQAKQKPLRQPAWPGYPPFRGKDRSGASHANFFLLYSVVPWPASAVGKPIRRFGSTVCGSAGASIKCWMVSNTYCTRPSCSAIRHSSWSKRCAKS